MKNFLKPNKTKIILSIIAIGIMIFSFSALAVWEVPGIPDGIVDKDLDEVVLDITDWLLGFAGILALLFIIWGGIQYTTAAGNENQLDNAKKTLKWGVGGLVICGLSYAIIAVVVGVWMGGSSSAPPIDPCTDLVASDLNYQFGCQSNGCEWFDDVNGCVAISILSCGKSYNGYYRCSTREGDPIIYPGEWSFGTTCSTNICCCQ